jgi:hypothetical protein
MSDAFTRKDPDLVRFAFGAMDRDRQALGTLMKLWTSSPSDIEANMKVEEDGVLCVKSHLVASFWDGHRRVSIDWTRSKDGFVIIAGPVEDTP